MTFASPLSNGKAPGTFESLCSSSSSSSSSSVIGEDAETEPPAIATESELRIPGQIQAGLDVMRRSISMPSQLSLLDTTGSLPTGVLFPLSQPPSPTKDRPPPPEPRTSRTAVGTSVGSNITPCLQESGRTLATSDAAASDARPPGPAAHNTPRRTTENIGVAPELRRVAEMVRSNQSRLESMVLSVSPPKAKIERPVRAAPRSPAQDPEHPEPPGQLEHRAERYDLQTMIGDGAFSKIYAAVDREGSSMVAIKVIDTLPSCSSEFAIMSGLDHENVVKCLGRSVTPTSTKCQ